MDLLRLPDATDAARCGHKAANLARLLGAGLPVPEGWVIPAEREPTVEALTELLAALGGRVAVRSSGVAEDREDASFAGLYETTLGVDTTAGLREAIARCRASAQAPRVVAYRAARGLEPAPVAVLVQRMVEARAAGVAFTADPVSGERGVCSVSAVGGLGESLVSGLADAEEWTLREQPERRRDRGLLRAEEVLRIGALARAAASDAPTDIEWALDGQDQLWLLQARPMTALPEPWLPPHPGGYARNLRLGEWIGNPVTPLFESWAITELEDQLHAYHLGLFGFGLSRPYHVLVNGWYFYGLNLDVGPLQALFALPKLLWSLITRHSEALVGIPPLAHLGFAGEYKRWKAELEPRLRAAVARAADEVETLPVAELPALVQSLLDETAVQLQSIAGVAGFASKAEVALLRLWRRHGVDGSPLGLVSGGGHRPAPHDVEDLDWSFPTLGERGLAPVATTSEQEAALVARRDADTDAALAGLTPKVRRALLAQIALCREAHRARIEQTGLFTLAWPVLRRALLRMGEALREAGRLGAAEDLFFLERRELEALTRGESLHPPVAERRALWARRRKLAPPLVLGTPAAPIQQALDEYRTLSATPGGEGELLRGLPASAGVATGPVRVVRDLEALDRLQPGEVLVAPVTTPAWTLAFGRAIAVVTDTGSLASHASVVAREHGLPAVVATGDATNRLVDGQLVTVDGGQGCVRRATRG